MILVIQIFVFYIYPVLAILVMLGLAVCLVMNRNVVIKF